MGKKLDRNMKPEQENISKPRSLPDSGLAKEILNAVGHKGNSAPMEAKADEAQATEASLVHSPVWNLPAQSSPAVASGAFSSSPSLMDFLRALPDMGPASEAESGVRVVQLVGMELGGELYGIDIQLVQEIIRVERITRVPGAPKPIRGITNLRGKILPVLDLRLCLGVGVASVSKRSRIVVADYGGKLLGLLVDAVQQVLQVDASVIEPPPEESFQSGGDMISGVAQLTDGRLLLLLELDRLIEQTSPSSTRWSE